MPFYIFLNLSEKKHHQTCCIQNIDITLVNQWFQSICWTMVKRPPRTLQLRYTKINCMVHWWDDIIKVWAHSVIQVVCLKTNTWNVLDCKCSILLHTHNSWYNAYIRQNKSNTHEKIFRIWFHYNSDIILNLLYYVYLFNENYHIHPIQDPVCFAN